MRSLWIRLAAVLPLCACNSDEPPQPTGPDHVAALDVTIEGDGSIDPKTVQLAIVWSRDRHVWPARELEPQELLIENHSLSWPLHMTALLTETPPYDPYWSAPTVGARPGLLVAYVDGNGNGKLDFTPVTADAFIDRLIAYRPDTRIIHYSTVNVVAQSVYVSNVGYQDIDLGAPITLLDRSQLSQSCNLLADWRPYSAYLAVFGGISIDPNDISIGPWDSEAEGDSPCPNNMIPPLTTEIACDGHALEEATTSAFISQTCGSIIRVCQFLPYMEPGGCTCDSTKYYCTDYEGGL